MNFIANLIYYLDCIYIRRWANEYYMSKTQSNYRMDENQYHVPASNSLSLYLKRGLDRLNLHSNSTH